MMVYRYGARRPGNLDLMLRIQRDAGRYYNALIEIERWRRVASELQHIAGEDWRDDIDRERKAAVRAARAASGLSAGTYWLVEEAVQRACGDTTRSKCAKLEHERLSRGGRGKPIEWLTMPCFRDNRSDPWQLIGACIPSANNAKPRAPADSGPDLQIVPDGRHHVARLRVRDSRKGGAWLDVPIKMHRPLPAGARIQRAALKVERIGTRYVYSVIVTLDASAPSRVTGSGACAVNLGWRSLGERGVRIAYTVGDVDYRSYGDEGAKAAQRLQKLQLAARYAAQVRLVRCKGSAAPTEAATRVLRLAST